MQRPTQEEKERKRKYREEQRKLAEKQNTLLKNRVGRAKTFRHLQEQKQLEADYSILEALRLRAKSASRLTSENNNNYVKQRREQSATARLRFYDNNEEEDNYDYERYMINESKIRFDNRRSDDFLGASSGYSSGSTAAGQHKKWDWVQDSGVKDYYSYNNNG